MFRCQFCGSHIFINELNFAWKDLLGLTFCQRAFKKRHQAHQDASFYKFQDNPEVIYESDTHQLLRVGEMRYIGKDQRFSYTPELLKARIIHDIALEMAFKKELLSSVFNPWFELSRKGKDDGIVFDNLDDALKELFRTSRKGGMSTAGQAVDEFLDTQFKPE